MPPGTRRPSIPSGTTLDLDLDPTAAALQAALGSRVVLIRALDQGGMGQVYLGRDPQLKRFVAVKVLGLALGPDVEARARFQLEAQAIAAVSHPYVVDIYGIGELPDGTPYFIMEYVAGGNMATRIATSGPLPIAAAQRVLGEVASALAAAHRRGIVHRDVKPANVLWDRETDRCAVSDFGIATLMRTSDDDEEMRITRAGMAVGSPAYMSPEQLLTEPATPASDVYAMGLLGYELLTGRGPFDATTPSAMIAAHLRDTPRPLHDLRPEAPPALAALLERCLAKDAAARPSADDVARALIPGAPDPLEWPPPGLEGVMGGLWRFTPWPAALATILLLPIGLLALPGNWFGGESVGWTLAFALTILTGCSALVVGLVAVWRALRSTARAASLGYGWLTITEVAADRRGDTGSLIAGTREYLSLTGRERARLRVQRLVAALVAACTGPLALLCGIAALMLLGGRRGGAAPFFWIIAGCLLAPATIARVIAVREDRRLRPLRRQHGDAIAVAHSQELIAPSWYAAFERARTGQRVGAGTRLQTGIIYLGGLALAAVLAWCASVLLLAGMFIFIARAVDATMYRGNYATAIARAEAVRPAVAYRGPVDSSISPLEAGEAVAAMGTMSSRIAPSPLERPPVRRYPTWTLPEVVPGLFPADSTRRDWIPIAIGAARRGLTAQQRDFLVRAAANPGRAEFSRAAAAPSIDVLGGLLVLPLPAMMSSAQLPTGAYGVLRAAAESHGALVALDVADGRIPDAERHAREVIALGASFMDGPRPFDVGIGTRMVRLGIEMLDAVYVATGRDRAARDFLDAVVRGGAGTVIGNVGADRRTLREAIFDPRIPRGIRMQLLPYTLFQSCSDPNQLLFGMTDEDRRLRRYATDSLARFPSERAIIELDDRMAPGRPRPPRAPGVDFADLARVVDAVVGGHRFEGCASYYVSPPRAT
jgi:hypothetical protein